MQVDASRLDLFVMMCVILRYLKALLELRPTSWEKRKSVAGRVNLLEGVVFRPYKILPRDGGFLDHSAGRRDG